MKLSDLYKYTKQLFMFIGTNMKKMISSHFKKWIK